MVILCQYTIYDHPRDYPEGFVVREWRIGPGTMDAGPARIAPTLAAARRLVPESASLRLARAPGDDPVIVETWT